MWIFALPLPVWLWALQMPHGRQAPAKTFAGPVTVFCLAVPVAGGIGDRRTTTSAVEGSRPGPLDRPAVGRTGLPDGGWLSAYDGYTTSDDSELDIDHVVPLGEAWRSDASRWDPARRAAYANDPDAPQSLIAVTVATNRSKSDKDPAIWQPSNTDAWCAYVRDWVTVKLRWT